MPKYRPRRERLKAASIKRRMCLSCDKPFLSLSPGNRICPACATRHEGQGLNQYVHCHATPANCGVGRRDSDAT